MGKYQRNTRKFITVYNSQTLGRTEVDCDDDASLSGHL